MLKWLVRAVMAMYKHGRTRVRSYGGSISEWFGVNVGVHQGSVLSPLLFIIVTGQGGGKCCGKAIGEVDSSTLGKTT